jgi:membrane protein YqaA with SNARE-associated domain
MITPSIFIQTKETCTMIDLISEYSLYASTYITCLVSGFVPIVNEELFLIGLSSVITKPIFLPLLFLATFGQMTAKAIVFFSGMGIFTISTKRYAHKIHEMKAKLVKWESKLDLVLFLSAFIGLPPFYVITFLLGSIRMNFFRFFIIGSTGRILRSGFIMLFTYSFKELL